MANSAGMLTGKLALVTGGGSGIGLAVCSVLAREGALLAVCGRNQSKVKETLSLLPKYAPTSKTFDGCAHSAFTCNVASFSEVTSMMQKIHKSFRAVPSVAVHSAGIHKKNSLLEHDEATFDDIIAVNLKGTFLVNQALAKAMIAGNIKNGSIVNISSILGKTAIENVGHAAYTTSKSGIIGFTKAAAKELAINNIRVNTVLPGLIKTPMSDTLSDKDKQLVIGMIPLKRMGTPEEIAEVCAFLVSDRSSYMTGSVVEVTGGLFA